MPKAEEELEPIDFDSVKECVMLYAISIGRIPTRLQTALDIYNEEWEQP